MDFMGSIGWEALISDQSKYQWDDFGDHSGMFSTINDFSAIGIRDERWAYPISQDLTSYYPIFHPISQ